MLIFRNRGYLRLTEEDPPPELLLPPEKPELLLPPEKPELLLPENELLRLTDDWRLTDELLLKLDEEPFLLNAGPEPDAEFLKEELLLL